MFRNVYRKVFSLACLTALWSPSYAQRNNDAITVVGREMYGVTALHSLSAQCPKRISLIIKETNVIPRECRPKEQRRFISIKSSHLKLPIQQLCRINRDLFSPFGQSNTSLDYDVTDVQPIHVSCLQNGTNISFYTTLKKRSPGQSDELQGATATQTLYINSHGTHTLVNSEIYNAIT
jgi:hypothetical protein